MTIILLLSLSGYSKNLERYFFWEQLILDNLQDINALWLFSFCISLGLAVLIVLFHKLFLNFDHSLSDVQVAHLVPTPRYGGVAVFSAIAASAFFFHLEDVKWIIVSSLPIFLIGLAEDCYFKTAPTLRFILGVISAVFGILLSGVVLNSVDFEYFDRLLSMPLVAFIFTVFCIVGLINAVNLIDGLHGLSSGVSVVMSVSFLFVSQNVGDVELAKLGMILAGASLGLMVLNFPFGKIFLGDSGAYFIGFSIAWLMILLAIRHEEVSKWSLLAIASWPIMETIFSIFRRKLRGRSSNKPDRMHFHHIAMRGLEIISRRRISRQGSNPLATILLLPLASLPALLGIAYSRSQEAGIIICISSLCAYILTYNGILFLLKKKKFRL